MKVFTATVLASALALVIATPLHAADDEATERILLSGELPALPAGLPDAAVGCVTVGMYFSDDGSVSRSWIMNSAFSRGLDQGLAQAYARSATEAAKSWKYAVREVGKPSGRMLGYGQRMIGFLPVDGRLQARAETELPEELRSKCRAPALREWLQQTAVKPENAPVKDKVIIVDAKSGRDVWQQGAFPPPRYPQELMQSKLQGCVLVGITVGVDGKPTRIEVLKAAYPPGTNNRHQSMFERSVRAAVVDWTFIPGLDNLTRHPALVQVPISFVLSNDSATRVSSSIEERRAALKSACEPMRDPIATAGTGAAP
jgi:TonB family protein